MSKCPCVKFCFVNLFMHCYLIVCSNFTIQEKVHIFSPRKNTMWLDKQHFGWLASCLLLRHDWYHLLPICTNWLMCSYVIKQKIGLLYLNFTIVRKKNCHVVPLQITSNFVIHTPSLHWVFEFKIKWWWLLCLNPV